MDFLFCIVLTYSYLWLYRRYFRSEKTKKFWFFTHLFVPLHPIQGVPDVSG